MSSSRLLHAISNFSLFTVLLIGLSESTWWELPFSESSSYIPSDLLLETGDLVFRQVNGPVSKVLESVDQQHNFSHVGIAYVTPNNEVFIIHVLPEGTTDTQLELVNDFLKDANDFAIYRPLDAISTTAIIATDKARSWIGVKKFDTGFDLQTDDELYCTELVYKAYLEAGVDIVNGEYDLAIFPFVGTKEVIFPSRFIQAGLFSPVHISSQ